MKLSDKAKKRLFTVCAVVFWIGVWQAAAMIINKSLILASPVEVIERLFTLVPEKSFFPSILFSLSKIMLGFLLGFFGLYLSTHSWAIPLIMLAAVGTAASNVSYPVTTRHAFGTRAYTTLYGYMMGINFITSSLGVVFANRIYTVTGSYNTVMFICMAASLAGLAALRLIRPARQDG